MSYYEECREALLDARDRFDDMGDYAVRQGIDQSELPGYEELRVAIVHLEELLDALEEA